jgi:predicted outer membrane repeat protein
MKRLLVLLVLSGLVLAPTSGTCAVIYVPSQQPTIQAGVNAAAVGDTVIVAPGIYSESVLLHGGPITLRSQAGPAITIIDATAFSQGILVYKTVDEGTILRGFTVQSGATAGVTCMVGTAVTIESMVLTQNAGPGIVSVFASPEVAGCVFYSNNDWGAATYGGSPVFTDCDFHGEGALAEDGAHVALKNCTFCGSGSFVERELRGSAVRVEDSELTAQGCTFSDYSGQSAISLYSTGPIIIEDCEFRRNYSELGAAIYCEGNASIDTPVTVTNTLFEDNSSGDNGGAIVLRWSESASFTGCTFRSNLTPGWGGAVSTHDVATVSYYGCEFYGNHGHEGGAVRAYGPTACELLIDHCLFVDNSCDYRGGSIRTSSCSGFITNCTIYGGDSTSEWGAIHCGGEDSGIVPDIVACIITGGEGYGISATGSMSVPLILYCDVYDMSSGAYASPIPDVTGYYGNISVDPLFCDAMSYDFQLHDLSPCATGGPSGGYIGAFDVGCTGTAVETKSWGAIKAMYR